jgi:hypothetical protein
LFYGRLDHSWACFCRISGIWGFQPKTAIEVFGAAFENEEDAPSYEAVRGWIIRGGGA